MEPLYEVGMQITHWLQQTYPGYSDFFNLVSDFGRFEFYLAVLPLILWCLDKRLGIYLMYLMVFADLTTNVIKHAAREPRPYWLEPSVQLSQEPSYGLPSSHALTTTVGYFFLAGWLRRRLVWLVCLLLVFLTSLARIYLGVHFLHQVVLGIVVGVIILSGYVIWRRYFDERFRKRILGQRLLIALIVPLLVAVVYTIIRFAIGPTDLTVAWAKYVRPAERESVEAVASNIGLLFGLGVGFALETSRVRFLAAGPVWKRVGRYILGMVVALLIWRGLGAVFPAEPLWLALPLRLFRYVLLGLWAAFYAPMTFVRLKLADASPDPGISLTM